MTDLSQTIAPKSDQLNSDDLIAGPRTIRITKVSLCAEPDQPVAVSFEGDDGKPYKPCKSMRRVLISVWGPDGASYVGRSLTIYRDDKVQFGGMAVGGIRISHMTHIDKPITMALTATRANRKPFTVKPLVVEHTADTNAPDRMRVSADRLLARIAGCNDESSLANLAEDPAIAAGRSKIAAARPELEAEIAAAFAARFADVPQQHSASVETLEHAEG